MKFRFQSLKLQCHQGTEEVPLDHAVSYFHGPISSGKSTIARLVDFCLGGRLEETPALKSEMVSASLHLTIGEYDVLLERTLGSANQVQATWMDEGGYGSTALVPIHGTAASPTVISPDVVVLSDLLFHLLGTTPIKVRKNKSDTDAQLIRLSFRDMMWYCYLDQDGMDSKFFNLYFPIVNAKSRDVMRFVFGYYTEKLNELDIEIENVHRIREEKLRKSNEIRDFLNRFGFGSVSQIETEIVGVQRDLKAAEDRQMEVRSGFTQRTSFADGTRGSLREISNRIAAQETAIGSLERRIMEYEALKGELVILKMKSAKVQAASGVLSSVEFEKCPACGQGLAIDQRPHGGVCHLCGQKDVQVSLQRLARTQLQQQDFNARIGELSDILTRHKDALLRAATDLAKMRTQRQELETRLDKLLKDFDSSFVMATREVDAEVATFREKLRSLRETSQIPAAITTLEREADNLMLRDEQLRRHREEEMGKFAGAGKNVRILESNFLEAMGQVQLPGLGERDEVHVDTTTWIPWVYPDGEKSGRWSFDGIGSGGKKTLLTVCYALAVHQTAAAMGLPLPPFLIIDGPMKNIDPEVNTEVFVSFHKYLYKLAAGQLRGTQFIMIDTEFVPDEVNQVDVYHRLMDTADPNNPPLIGYYTGP